MICSQRSMFFLTLLIRLIVPSGATADEPVVLSLDFEREMLRLERRQEPIASRWKYYITQPRDVGKFVRLKDDHIQPSADGLECRILSHENYVIISRLIDEDFAQARKLSWKWRVAKHPPGGSLGKQRNDQSIIVYAVFRLPKDLAPNKFDYHAIGFCWTESTSIAVERRHAELPWRRTQQATVIHVAIRNGVADDPEEFIAESVDLETQYRKHFPGSGQMPELWGISLMGDSNDVAVFEKMTTDATIRELRLEK